MNLLEARGITKIVNYLYQSNTYIVEYGEHCAFVVDPGSNWQEVEEIIRNKKINLTNVFCTHGHFDHVGGVADVVEKFGSDSVIHKADAKMAARANFLLMAFGLKDRIRTPEFRHLVSGGEIFDIGGSELRIEHVPGHSAGSCFLFFKDMLFSGDSLYSRGIGVKSPDQDTENLRSSLLKWWKNIPDETLVCPGHGNAGIWRRIRTENEELLRLLKIGGKSS